MMFKWFMPLGFVIISFIFSPSAPASNAPADWEPFPPTRLPRTGEFLIGRSRELRQITSAWKSRNTSLVQIVAPGGIGKTQLTKKWREKQIRREDCERDDPELLMLPQSDIQKVAQAAEIILTTYRGGSVYYA